MSSLPRVFISYSHDSPAFKQLVLNLANKLRESGIDARIDQYVPAPPEGWPRWMEHRISEADYVLLVCTETYHERVSMNAPPGKGLGALWESHLVYQFLYEAGTVNPKFIPLLPPGGDTKHIPVMLRGVQRYEPFTEDGFLDLYRRLTDQPAVLMPVLGKPLVLPPAQRISVEPPVATLVQCKNSQRAVIIIPDEGLAFIPVVQSHWGDQEATMIFEPDEDSDGAFLDGLRNGRRNIQIAYRWNAAICSVETVEQRTSGGADQWHVTFRLQKTDFWNSMEFSMNDLTPDKAAVIRARRLLLNENPYVADERGIPDMTREIMIRGQQTDVKIEKSPLPELFGTFQSQPELFVEAAWVLVVLLLKMSGTVEQISRLELTLTGNELQVEYAGRRKKQYTNKPAFQMEVSGVCRL